MTSVTERLRSCAKEIERSPYTSLFGVDAGLLISASDEIERLKTDINEAWSAMAKQIAYIKELEGELK